MVSPLRSRAFISILIIACLFVGATSVLGVPSTAQAQDPDVIDQTENTTHGHNVSIKLDSQHNLTVTFERVRETVFSAYVWIEIDGYQERKDAPELEVGDEWSTTVDVATWANVSKDNHNVTVTIYGRDFNTSFHKDYDLEDPDIPATRIRDVEVIETRNDGERTAAVDIVLENPSPRSYAGKVYIHTIKSTQRSGLGTVPIRTEREVARVHLREGPDEDVEGELRLTTTHLDEDTGLRDQVWFRGTADGETEWQREPYEPVEYRSSDDPYRYTKDEGFFESIGLPIEYAAGAGVIAIAFLIFLFRGRSKW